MFRNFHQMDQRRLQLRGALQNSVLPEPLGILPLFLLGVEGGQLLLFVDAGGGDCVDELLCPGKILPIAVIGDAHGQGSIPDLRRLAVGHGLIKGHQPISIVVRVWNAVEKAGTVQIENDRIDQGFTVGVLVNFFHGCLKGGLIPLFTDHFVQVAGKTGDLLGGQILLKGQQGVEVGMQHPGQGGQGGDVRVCGSFFPLVDCRSRHPQQVCQLLLGQGELLSLFSNDFTDFHTPPPILVPPTIIITV